MALKIFRKNNVRSNRNVLETKMEQDASKECQRHPSNVRLGDLSAAAGHTPLISLNSQTRSTTVTLSLCLNSFDKPRFESAG